MIKNVVFDIGMVLVDFRWRALMDELGFPEALRAEFAKSVFGSPWWNELDRGVCEESEVLEKLRDDNRAHVREFDMIWERRAALVEPYEHALPWIKRLKARGLGIYLLSNYPRDLFRLHAQCGAFPFLDEVDGKVISGFVRMVKPDAAIYGHLLGEYGLNAAECVFLDDRTENVRTAETLGMRGIVFGTYGQASAELDRITAGQA